MLSFFQVPACLYTTASRSRYSYPAPHTIGAILSLDDHGLHCVHTGDAPDHQSVHILRDSQSTFSATYLLTSILGKMALVSYNRPI